MYLQVPTQTPQSPPAIPECRLEPSEHHVQSNITTDRRAHGRNNAVRVSAQSMLAYIYSQSDHLPRNCSVERIRLLRKLLRFSSIPPLSLPPLSVARYRSLPLSGNKHYGDAPLGANIKHGCKLIVPLHSRRQSMSENSRKKYWHQVVVKWPPRWSLGARVSWLDASQLCCT